MNNKIAIESLSMDLLRVALGYQRGSEKMVKRFSIEALRRCSEVKKNEVKPYFAKILNKVESSLENIEINRIAEDTLMYSILCKNYALTYLT